MDEASGNSGWFALDKSHYHFLQDHIDPDFGLLTKLVSKNILSYRQRDIIKSENTVDKKNGKLLDIIRDEDKWDGLIDALRSSNQGHVVNYLKADGIVEYSPGVDWPLGEREEKILRANLEQLYDLLETTELIVKLHSMNVINRRQRDFINVKQTSSDRNEAFLDILQRRSIADYNRTIYFLKETKQSHIAQLLEEGGAIVELHVNTDGDPEAEEEIADKFKDILDNRSVAECRRILEPTHWKIIAAKTGHSIVLYVYLQTIKQLNQLKASLQCGLIKKSIQLLFNEITSLSRPVAVTVLSVTASEDELRRVEDILKGLYRNQRQSHNIIRNNYHYFESSTEFAMPNLIGNLKFNDCITDVQAASIQRQKHGLLKDTIKKRNSNKAWDLFEIAKSLDESRYSSFIRCLRQTGCQNISKVMAIGGGVISLRCWPRTKARYPSGDEVKKINTEINEVDTQAANQLERKLSEFDVEIVESSLDRDSVWWIWCRSMKGFKNLQESDASKRIIAEIVKTIGAELITDVDNESIEKTIEIRSEVASDSPLTDAQLKILNDNHETLVDRIDMNHLVSDLVARNVINQWQEELIASKRTLAEKNEALLKILRRLSKEEFALTMECLYESKQNTAAQFLGERVNFARLGRYKEFLEKNIDSDSGLMEKLLSTNTLTEREILSIRGERTYQRRNAKLLEHITDQRKCNCFVDSLSDTKQEHVVNYLIGDGKFRSEFGDEWPLTDAQKKMLNDVRRRFEDVTDISDLLRRLCGSEVINQSQRDLIDSEPSSIEKINVIIDILLRQSQEDFKQTINCLREAHHDEIGWILKMAEPKAVISVETVARHESFLEKVIDPDFGLLDELLDKETFSSTEIRFIKEEETYVRRNARLLKYITSRQTCDSLVDALGRRRQTHVVNYLLFDGKFTRKVRDDWPVTEDLLEILSKYEEQLLVLIEIEDLAEKLLATRVINREQKQVIDSKETSPKKIKVFLEILRRMSLNAFRQTINFLYVSKQGDVRQILLTVAINVWTLAHHKSYLEQVIDTDSGLLDELLLKETMSSDEMRSIKEEQSHDKRNAKVLEYIISKQHCASFVDLLKNSGQTHVVDYLTFDEIGYAISYNMPLTQFSLHKLFSLENKLLGLIELRGRLGETLYARELINRKQKEIIDSKETSTEKNKAFLEILRRMTLGAFRQTIKCLHASNQADAARILEKTEKMFYISVATLDRHKSYLEQIIDPDSGLLDDLLLKETLSSKEILSVKEELTYVKRNAKLLDCITSKEKCNSFVDSLQLSRQTHVVNYLAFNGKFKNKAGNDWPLTKASLEILSICEQKLLELIEMRALPENLFAKGVINWKQLMDIDSKQTSNEKKNAFLEILRRMSLNAFRQTSSYLYDLNQKHVYWILSEVEYESSRAMRIETERFDTHADYVEGCISPTAVHILPLSH